MFTLKVPVTPVVLAAIKAELTRALLSVKSSHRCEAIARGLGFRTYAALLAGARSNNPVTATAQGATFSSYLSNHQLNVPPQPFYRAVARVAIRGVLERTPRLTALGMGVGQPSRNSSGQWESGGDRREKYLRERAELLSNFAIEPFLLSLAFLSRVKPTQTIRRSTNSYWLKHIVEKYACSYPEGDELGPTYVSNGVLIAAVIHAGFHTKTHVDDLGYESLNVTFNMSKPSLVDLDCEIRPEGRAQSRRRRKG